MGRFTSTPSNQQDFIQNPGGMEQNNNTQYNQNYNQPYVQPQQGMSQGNFAQPQFPSNWPTVFNKPVIGIERNGVIIEDSVNPISSPNQVTFIPGSLDAIRMMRLKGYKVAIIYDEPAIYKGKLTTQQVDGINQYLMQMFGQAGIFSIDGLLYSTTDLKDDIYAKPNVGMFKRAETEFQTGIKWNEGWFVGHNIKDVVAADKINAKPVLVKTGNGQKTLNNLTKNLKDKVLVFDNLLDFANSLE